MRDTTGDYSNTGRRINNGFIRLGHSNLEFSDRDYTSYNKGLKDLKRKTK